MNNPINARSVLLQALLEGPGYGSDLVEKVKKRTKNAIDLGAGSIYPAIRDLTKAKLIAKDSSEGRATLFKLTAAGKKAAADDKKVVKALFDL